MLKSKNIIKFSQRNNIANHKNCNERLEPKFLLNDLEKFTWFFINNSVATDWDFKLTKK